MLTGLHARQKLQLAFGFIAGIMFGFLLQKGGVNRYDVILGQLLLTDFTVLKIMLTAAITGMAGIHLMRSLGWVEFHPKPGSWGMSAIGGLIFGVGFAVLGYCPGTMVGAIGNGFLDAIAGAAGITIGAGLFAEVYPRLADSILMKGYFGDISLPRVFRLNEWVFIIPFIALMVLLMVWLESMGL